jgi:NAD(P)H-hydrate epimerase
MLAIEGEADASGLSYAKMMANAGQSIAGAILERWPECGSWNVLLLIGPGNNGGDGLVAGHLLAEAGASVTAYLSRARSDEDPNLGRLKRDDQAVILAEDDEGYRKLDKLVAGADMILDALLGTGIKLPLKGTIKKVLTHTQAALDKRSELPVIVAVDCPSGLDCDSGALADETIKANLTVTLAAAKVGQFIYPGAGCVGELEVADIGIDPSQESLASVPLALADRRFVKPLLPTRPADSHKGTFGRIIIAAGSVNYPGSLFLAGGAAYRVGSGLVTLASVRDVYSGLIGALPEATWILLPDELGVISEAAAGVLIPELERASAFLVGPGFGLESTSKAFLNRIFSGVGVQPRLGFVSPQIPQEIFTLPPCVVDADGLKLLVELEDWTKRLPPGSVLTPHPGEMAIMTGMPVGEIQADRRRAAAEHAEEWGHVVVLKGAFTIVAGPDGRQALLPFASSSLAKAGTGDVLAGVIVGLLGQGMDAYDAAVLGCWLHARAGQLAAEWHQSEAGVVAGELLDFLPLATTDLVKA